MAKLIQLSGAANLALHALAYLGFQDRNRLISSSSIANALGVSEAHLSKVLRTAVRYGIIRSARGAKGGFSLLRDPEHVSLLEIVEMIDGPIVKESCLLASQVCVEDKCVLGNFFDSIHKLARQHLAQSRLSDFRFKSLSGGSHEGQT